jgi:enoyl-CoA hydratase/carnithine racemase
MLGQELTMPLDAAIDAEAREQALLMRGNDFRRAYDAFVEKRTPVFEGD